MKSTSRSVKSEEAIRNARACPDSKNHLFQQLRSYLYWHAEAQTDLQMRRKVDASDIVQLTLAEANRDFEQFVGDQNLLHAWALKILIRNLIDAKRSFTKAQKRDVNRERAMLVHPYSKEATASAVLMERERGNQLRNAVASLPPKTRQLVELRHRDGLGFNEIGRRLNMSPEAARQIWSRALRELEKQLAEL